MKTRILVVTVVCVVAGLLGWFLNPPSADAAKPVETKTTTTANAPKTSIAPPVAAPVAPVKPAQVAAPVVAAARPDPAAPFSTTPAVASATQVFVAEPKTDLKECISTMIHYLDTQDVLGLVKTIMPPDAISRMIQSGQASSIEDVAEHYRQMPDVSEKMSQLLFALQNVQGQEPEMNADGTQATYKIDQSISGPGKPPAPAGTPGQVTFVKIDGFWYLR